MRSPPPAMPARSSLSAATSGDHPVAGTPPPIARPADTPTGRSLQARQQVEECARRVYALAFDLDPEAQRHKLVRLRLMLLACWAHDDQEFLRYRAVATQLAWVYYQCCAVLHGRRAFTELPEPEVIAWEATVRQNIRIVNEIIGQVPRHDSRNLCPIETEA